MRPENIVEICVAIDIAILGIAYPIIIDKISNIGDKYSSVYIAVVFKNEFPHRPYRSASKISIFQIILFVTITSFILLIFPCAPPLKWNYWILDNSANILVFSLTIALITLFLIWLDKVALYTGKSTELLRHLINNYNKSSVDSEIKNYQLKAINEVAFYAIEKQDEHLQQTLFDFYFDLILKIRRNHNKSIPLIYPVDIYILIHKLNRIVSINKTSHGTILESAVSGAWLIGVDNEPIIISEETYRWLWANILLSCECPRLIKTFWANSSQYINYNLQPIYEEYNNEGNITNKAQISESDSQRTRFLELHYVLGGLLLYKKQYESLKYLFEFTQSQPPTYPLLPNRMNDIFDWFLYFNNDLRHSVNLEIKYSFPELDNLGSRRQIGYWISSYLTLLFLRQFSLTRYLTYQDFTSQPSLPESILELRNWNESISYFEKCLKNILDNKNLLKIIGFKELSTQKAESIKQFIQDLKNNIQHKIGYQKLNVRLSPEKIKQFNQTTEEIITRGFSEYQKIFIDKTREHVSGDLKLSIKGERILTSKSSFTEDDIPSLNYDSFFAHSIVTNNIRRFIPNTFFMAKTQRYLFNKENIIAALSKLIDNQEDITIIAINAGFDLRRLLDPKIIPWSILFLPSSEPSQRDTLFVLRKADLPALEHKELPRVEIDELRLKLISPKIKLYTSVIDINLESNKNINYKEKLNDDSETELQVQLTIAFWGIIYWRNQRNIIQINLASDYRELGIQNVLTEIEPMGAKT